MALAKNPLDRPTILDMLHHPWVESYRSRRSMRSISAATQPAAPAPTAASPTIPVAVAGAPARKVHAVASPQPSAPPMHMQQGAPCAVNAPAPSAPTLCMSPRPASAMPSTPVQPIPVANVVRHAVVTTSQPQPPLVLRTIPAFNAGAGHSAPPNVACNIVSPPSGPATPAMAISKKLLPGSPTSPLAPVHAHEHQHQSSGGRSSGSDDAHVFMSAHISGSSDWTGPPSRKAPAAQIMARYGGPAQQPDSMHVVTQSFF